METPSPSLSPLEVTCLPNLVETPELLFERVLRETVWDERMRARRTASFGVAYNYSGMSYPDVPMPPYLAELAEVVASRVRHPVNSCLANWYADGTSTMGFHSDATADLMPESTVAVLSLGAARTLTFRRKALKHHRAEYVLEPGALLIMQPSVQAEWQHALLKAHGAGPRISLTFRWVRPAPSASA